MEPLTINTTSDAEEEFLGKKTLRNLNTTLKTNEFKVTYNDPMCEEHAQIEKIVPLTYRSFGIFLFVLLNICTGSLFTLVVVWWPKLRLFFFYQIVSIEAAKLVAVSGSDGDLYFIDLEKPHLPDLEQKNSFLYSHYSINIPRKVPFIILFTFKLFKYVYDPLEGAFVCLKAQLDTTNEQIIQECCQGLTPEEYEHQRLIYGICDLDIKIKSFLRLLFEEFTDPFYIFQVASVILWFLNEYKLYASIIIAMTLVSLFVGTYETRANLKKIQRMARYSCPVNILRKSEDSNKGVFEQKSSTELVPGDVFEVQEEGLAMPCDCLLIQGTVIINEAMLTGESTPIIKSQIPLIHSHFNYDEDKKYFLFAGTKIIQKRCQKNQKVLALVTESGFSTIKGNLIRSILYPKAMDEKFTKDSYKYIAMMSIICVIGFAISIPFLVISEVETKQIVVKSLDLITTVVPPSLPACLGIGITYAISRLKKKGIVCVARERVNIAGKINILCFDKTGTLTEDHLDIYGYRSVKMKKNSNEFEFNPFIKTALGNADEAYDYYKKKKSRAKNANRDKNKDLNQYFVECCASCHCATYVGENIIGDPIDVKMFESSGWTLHENVSKEENASHDAVSTFVRPGREEDLQVKLQRIKEKNLGPNEIDEIDKVMEEHYELGIVRRFDFVPKLQRMSVITKNVNDNYYKVFCKGSPEKIKELCLPETVPEVFNDTLNKYAIKGFRVLAMSFKAVKMSYIQSQQISRDKAESKMIFLGLLIVQNKLKPETKPTLNILEKAGLKMVMATGDNILTAISVSKECELIKKNSLVYSCEIEGNKLLWNTIENFDEENDPGEFTIEPLKEGEQNNNIIFTGTNDNQGEIFEKNVNKPKEEEEEFTIKANENIYRSVADFPNTNNNQNLKIDPLNTNNIKTSVMVTNPLRTSNNPLRNSRISIASGLGYDGCSFIDSFPPDRYSILYSKRPSIVFKNPIFPGQSDNVEVNITGNDGEEESPLMGLEIKEYPFKGITEDYVIAMTGKTFEKLYAFRNKYQTSKNESFKIYEDVFRIILLHGRVFARMAPEHKAILVEGFKKEELAVLMCGDGANDCMALRTADIGVSLSQEEASIAAPFTSINPNISCLVNLLKEGKASLVTSIQTFKYMMIYSLVQFICVTLLMVLNSYLSENQFLAVDMVIIIPLAFFIPQTGPYKYLTKQHPTDSLISYPVICSILSQTLIALIFQLLAYVLCTYMDDYENICEPDEESLDIASCPINTAVFYVSNFQYLVTAIAFSISKPFRSPIYTNVFLMIFMLIAFGYSTYIVLFPDKWSIKLLQLYYFDDPELSFRREEGDEIDGRYQDHNMKYYIEGLTLLNFLVSYLFEKVIVPTTTACWNERKKRQLRERKVREPENSLTMQQLLEIEE